MVGRVDRRCCCSYFMCPLMVGIEGSKCLVMRSVVRPGQVVKFPLLIALMKEDLVDCGMKVIGKCAFRFVEFC